MNDLHGRGKIPGRVWVKITDSLLCWPWIRKNKTAVQTFYQVKILLHLVVKLLDILLVQLIR